MGTQVMIELVDASADLETVDELTADLREELLQLDVDAVVPVPAGPAPAGSKGAEAIAVGALLLQLHSSLPLLQAVLTAARAWLTRRAAPGRTVKVTVDGSSLELSAATVDQQQRLVDEFVRSLRP